MLSIFLCTFYHSILTLVLCNHNDSYVQMGKKEAERGLVVSTNTLEAGVSGTNQAQTDSKATIFTPVPALTGKFR